MQNDTADLPVGGDQPSRRDCDFDPDVTEARVAR
jgi:hypothetical protein